MPDILPGEHWEHYQGDEMSEKRIIAPTYTQVPNVILDALHEITDPELRLCMAISRETFGWHRQEVKLSIPKIMQLSGLSHGGVHTAIKRLVEREWLLRTGDGNSFKYHLNVIELTEANHPPGGRVANGETIHQVDGNHPPHGRVPIHQVDGPYITKRNTKERIKKEDPTASAVPSPHTETTRLWEAAFLEVHKTKYTFNGGRDAKAIKTLLASELTPGEIVNLARFAWGQDSDRFLRSQALTIHGLLSVINQIRVAFNKDNALKPPTASGYQTMAEYRAWAGLEPLATETEEQSAEQTT